MALKNFTQFTPYTVLSGTDIFVGYRGLDEIRSDLSSITDAISGLLIAKGFTPGSSVGVVRRVSFRYTIASSSPVNAVSGVDDYGLTLSYNPSQIEVYRNGAHLVESLDFIANNGTQVTNLSTLNVGDIVEVVALSSTVLNFFITVSGSGQAQSTSFRYTVAAGNTITPGSTVIGGADDFGSVMLFTVPNFEVYLNGSHLVRDQDYGTYSTGSSLILVEPVADGDTVDVVSLSAYNLSQIAAVTAYSGIQRIQAGKDITISNITGTGSVTLSAKTGIRDIKVPTWTDGGHVTGWSTVQQYLSAVAQSNRFTQASAVYLEVFGSGSYPYAGFTNDWEGGVLAPNGKIYVIPEGSSLGLIIDPVANTVKTLGGFIGASAARYQGGVLASNGKIYCIPCGAGAPTNSTTVFQFIDPSTDTVSAYASVASLNLQTTPVYQGGVLAPNGKIYMAPAFGTVLYLIDPSTNTVSAYQTISYTPGAYANGCVGPNGKIYLVPNASTLLAKIDPDTNTFTQFVASPVGPVVSGAGLNLAPNGKLYFTPTHSIGYVLDPFDNDRISTYSCAPAITGNITGWSGKLAPNGKIYFASYNGTFFGVLDPETETVTRLGTVTAFAHLGSVLTPNGKFILLPAQATSIAAYNLNLNNNFNINVCTNPFFNKN